jgi:hypothetical protein
MMSLFLFKVMDFGFTTHLIVPTPTLSVAEIRLHFYYIEPGSKRKEIRSNCGKWQKCLIPLVFHRYCLSPQISKCSLDTSLIKIEVLLLELDHNAQPSPPRPYVQECVSAVRECVQCSRVCLTFSSQFEVIFKATPSL